MAHVLALEPDHRQATALKRVISEHVRAELTLVDSRDAALAAIAERMPDVGRQYYEHVIDRTTRELAAWLDSEVEAKRLSIDDTALAAQQFMLSCQAKLFLPFILQVAPSPSRAQIAKVVASATKMFLAAYRR